MRNMKKALIALITGLALTAGIVSVTTETASATSQGNAYWKLCSDYYLDGTCAFGGYYPIRNSDLRSTALNDNISSIQTNFVAIETWNDINFKGTYGYFQPNYTWNVLTSPYNNSISSVSFPGAVG
ncbi:hypothetical protein AB0395_40085 [Streptosporangium sp. NPDC051023]|uniref:hypothetical protein n=1 Tax=Streptosporangium sp. NPDC051023 TaxID=3155410 RepID=UPI00344E8F34